MLKTLATTAALTLAAANAQANSNPNPFNLPLDFAILTPAAEEAPQIEEVAYYCEWVTVYDYWGNWVTVWQCY